MTKKKQTVHQSKNTTTILLCLFVLILSMFGIVYYQNKGANITKKTEQDRVYLKEYTNKDLGFSFNYPSDYILEESRSSVSLNSPQDPNFSPDRGYLADKELKIEIYIEDSKKQDNLSNFAKDAKANASFPIGFEEKISLSGHIAYHIQFDKASDLYLIVNNNRRISILKYPVLTTRQEEFEKILKSFRLLTK